MKSSKIFIEHMFDFNKYIIGTSSQAAKQCSLQQSVRPIPEPLFPLCLSICSLSHLFKLLS